MRKAGCSYCDLQMTPRGLQSRSIWPKVKQLESDRILKETLGHLTLNSGLWNVGI